MFLRDYFGDVDSLNVGVVKVEYDYTDIPALTIKGGIWEPGSWLNNNSGSSTPTLSEQQAELQGALRMREKYVCALCGTGRAPFQASHIVPQAYEEWILRHIWAYVEPEDSSYDVTNGLWLCDTDAECLDKGQFYLELTAEVKDYTNSILFMKTSPVQGDKCWMRYALRAAGLLEKYEEFEEGDTSPVEFDAKLRAKLHKVVERLEEVKSSQEDIVGEQTCHLAQS
ncbi:hypothetical protein HK104_006373 [Borealophlyctis nickersoniae]|nr:hypothetical protein HK104_006373 [Borealophlyctis nickersoniae]